MEWSARGKIIRTRRSATLKILVGPGVFQWPGIAIALEAARKKHESKGKSLP
jgi:hypothetical protein